MELWKRSVYVLVVCTFCMSFGISQLSPILPLYFHQMGVNSPEALSLWSGLATGVTYLVVCLVAPFWGRLADRKGRKITLVRSSLGMALCNIAIAFASTPETVIILRAIQGLVNGFYSASVTLVASETPQEHTGWALGVLTTGQMSGYLVGPLIGGYLADLVGIHNDFLIVGAFMLTAFVIVTFFVHEEYVPKPSKAKQSLSALKAQIPDFKAVIALYGAMFIFAICAQTLQPIITVYVKEILPAGTPNLAFIAGAVFSCTGIAQLLSSSYLGRLVDKVGPRQVLLIALLYVGLLNIPQAYVSDVYTLGFIRFLQGLGMGGLLPALNTYLSSKTPKNLTGQVFAYTQSFQFLGYFIGSLGGASLMATLGFTSLFWISATLFIIAAAWIKYKVPDTAEENKI